MTEIGDAIGTASEGSLLARAASPPDAGGDKGHFHEQACLNCGTALVGPHCHGCGQQAHLHRSVGGFLHDLFHGALHIEGRTWHTMPLLALRPGQLTRRYIDGERRRFVSPMALFLFSVFLMFAVFTALGITPPPDLGRGRVAPNLELARQTVLEEREAARAALAALPPGASGRAAAERRLAEAEADVEGVARMGDIGSGIAALEGVSLTGIEAIDKGLIEKWRKNPSLMLYKLQSNGYKYSWLLIPLSVPFLWLLFFWKRRFGGYDHAVFVTYSLAFMSLLFVALSLAGMAGVPSAALVLAGLLLPPLHIYRQLRGAYALSRFGALWRLAVLLMFILVVIVLFLEALLVLGAF